MSVQAIAWALENAPIPNVTPTGMPTAPALVAVLVGLANHAGADGRNAYPSISTLSRYARLSDRQTKRALAALAELGVIELGNQAIAAADIKRADRRPTVYNLNVSLTHGVSAPSPRDANGVTGETERGDRRDLHGVTAPSPEPKDKPKDEPKDPDSDEPDQIAAGIDPELALLPAGVPVGNGVAKTRRRKPKTPIPADWLPTDKHQESAHKRSLHLHNEAEKFRGHALANDRRQSDWDAAFGNWLISAEEFASRRGGSHGGRQTHRDRNSGLMVER